MYVILIVSMIVPNHFPFMLGLKLLFSTSIATPAKNRSFLTSLLAVLANLKLQVAAILSLI